MLLTGTDRNARPVILALGATQIIGYGALYYAYAVLAPAMAAEFAVSETAMFAVFSVGLLLAGVTAPLIGSRIDRHGAAWVMAVGSAVISALLVALAQAPNFAAFAVLLVLIEMASFAVLYDAAFATLAGHAPNDSRGAITKLTLIAGFASTIFWPLTGWLAGAVGWRGAYLVFAALTVAVAIPLHLWIAARPYPARTPAVGAVRSSPRGACYLSGVRARRAFWLVGFGFALSGMVISAITIHMVPILLAREMGDAAFLAAMMMGPAQVLIRVVDATLWRRLHPVAVAVMSAAVLPLAVLMLLVPGPALVTGIGFAVLLGTGGGLASIVRGAVPVALFGTEGLGLRLGRLAAIRTVLGASAPFVFAVSSTQIGASATLGLTAALGLAGLALMIVLHRVVHGRDAALDLT